ncbi:MAG TPA: AAA family ATPase, partial [Pirellulales bacterium]|nr:AAA family ATPase [Pirellulales bacterium]
MPINKTNRVEPPPPLDPPEVRRLSDIAICPTLWLWPGRVALGQLTLVAGEPGAGTSLLLMDLASRVSRGTPFP